MHEKLIVMKRYLIVHYGEIGLKGANVDYFVEKLCSFMKLKLEKKFQAKFVFKHSLRRLMALLPDNFVEKDYVELLSKISGIKNFKFVYEGPSSIEELSAEIWKNLPGDIFESENPPKSFKVEVKRSMLLPLKSFEAARDIGAYLLENGINLKVSLKHPEFVVDVEFFNNHGYFSFKKYAGPGGFPTGSQSKLISLISSGFDSPVAAYFMMRRGARVIFVHFHGYPYTDKDEMEQVKDIVKILSDYQLSTRLYLVPFGEFQKAIGTNLEIPGKLRTVLYRRMMLMVAQQLAKKEGAKGLITGDNYGQVASQTPENIFAIHDASSIPLFQPLIAFDKEDIIRVAEKIGTAEVSKLPCKDSCTMFMPKSPELRARVSELRGIEQNFAADDWVSKLVEQVEILAF